jgi:hypothetical protein
LEWVTITKNRDIIKWYRILFRRTKTNNNLIKAINNSYNSTGAELINPTTNRLIRMENINIPERISIINNARGTNMYFAPENSYAVPTDPIIADTLTLNLDKVNFASTSAAQSNNLPGNTVDEFTDVPLGPEPL